MIFYRFFIFFIVILGGYLIYKVAFDAWKKTSTMDKIDEIELEKEIHHEIDGVDIVEAEKNKHDIEDFLEKE